MKPGSLIGAASQRSSCSSEGNASNARRGQAAESLVAEYLVERGFQIIARNLRLGHLELDIVARQGDLVAVVEVRERGPGAWTTGLSSIGARKRLRVRRAGERLWRRRFLRDPSVSRMRFDAASVERSPQGARVVYVPAAF